MKRIVIPLGQLHFRKKEASLSTRPTEKDNG